MHDGLLLSSGFYFFSPYKILERSSSRHTNIRCYINKIDLSEMPQILPTYRLVLMNPESNNAFEIYDRNSLNLNLIPNFNQTMKLINTSDWTAQ